MRDGKGFTEPRIYTPPLRELTPETSNGFAFIDFCRDVLGVELYPWQKWLARHAMELNEDGTYRFDRVLVMVARQNGKTTFASCLAAWWLFVEAHIEPRKRPEQFKVVGIAQNIKTAALPYQWVLERCDPRPPTPEDAERVIPVLGDATSRIVRARGAEEIITKAGARYEVREGTASRGQPAARVLMDEIREHHKWDGWNSVSNTTKDFANGQLWGITNAGEARSVVLNTLREEALTQVELARSPDYPKMEEADETLGFFEWSAPEDADPLDEDAILAANPSIGYGGITVKKCRASYRSMTEAAYRAETLCQYVPATVTPYIDPKDYEACVVADGSYTVPAGARTVWAVDTSADRKYTSIAGAVMCDDGVPLVALVRDPRLSMVPIPDEVANLAREASQFEVMIQERGCPAMEFVQPLEERGLNVRRVPGSWFGVATGRMRDAIREGRVRFVQQESVAAAVSAGVTRHYGETDAWDRRASVVDIAPLVACTLALYGLENPIDVPLSAYETRGLMKL